MAFHIVFRSLDLLKTLEAYADDCLVLVRATLADHRIFRSTVFLRWEYRVAYDVFESCIEVQVDRDYWDQAAREAVLQWERENFPEEFRSDDD